MKQYLLVALVTALCFQAVFSACFRDIAYTKIQGKKGGMKGKVTFCKYQNAEILVGSDFKTADCYTCSCRETGLSCCGFGASLPIGFPPISVCEPRNSNCAVEWVYTGNWIEQCTGPVPQINKQSGD